MRIPYSWLNSYLNTNKSPEELAEVLTMGGLEVEEIQDWTSPDGAETDRVLLTKVTANRGDLLSMVGVARLAGALLGIEADTGVAKRCDLEVTSSTVGGAGAPSVTAGPARVEIADPEGCPRYTALLIEGLKIGPSPDWLANRLLAAGMRPICSVVDATNYVMWELGQPLHAFDFDLLAEDPASGTPALRTIIVRKAVEGETLVTLDDQERTLTSGDLLITDRRGPVALAGVMGGANTEMAEGTTRVLVESAHFDPSTVRKTALRLGMSTEASYRLERHVDPNLTLVALSRVAELITEMAGGTVVCPVLDARTREFEPRRIDLRPARCNAILGTDLSPTQMAEYLRAIEFGVEPAAGGGADGTLLTVTVPTVRPDIEREIDLIEEIAIVHGYNRIPMTIPGRLPASAVLTDAQRLERRARTILRACGLNETLAFSMMCDRDLDRIGLPREAAERRAVRLANPMLAEQDEMRTTLLPGLLAACETNARQRITDVALYEVNPVFTPTEGARLPHEGKRVAGIIMGSPWMSGWNIRGEEAKADFFWLKGIVEQLLAGLNVAGAAFRRAKHPSLAAGRCAEVVLGTPAGEQAVGYLGEIAAPVQAAFDLPEKAYAFELDLDALLAAAYLLSEHTPAPRFPAALRDLALLVDDDDAHSAAEIAAAIEASGGEYLCAVRPFDLYKDEKRLGRGRKSVAFSLEFRAPERTLTDDEVDAAMAAIVSHLEATLKAEVRKA